MHFKHTIKSPTRTHQPKKSCFQAFPQNSKQKHKNKKIQIKFQIFRSNTKKKTSFNNFKKKTQFSKTKIHTNFQSKAQR